MCSVSTTDCERADCVSAHTSVHVRVCSCTVRVCFGGCLRQVAAALEGGGGGEGGTWTPQPSPNSYFSPVLTSPVQ